MPKVKFIRDTDQYEWPERIVKGTVVELSDKLMARWQRRKAIELVDPSTPLTAPGAEPESEGEELPEDESGDDSAPDEPTGPPLPPEGEQGQGVEHDASSDPEPPAPEVTQSTPSQARRRPRRKGK
ncbi:hypothetical protein [Bremerella cremea]|uniref:hypothetical protein n=1 Tax=Bremerella cremea TaxID=1031537 RepID=UPI0031EA1697